MNDTTLLRIFREVKLSDTEEDTIWTVYERINDGSLSKEKGLKTYEKILRVKLRLLSPPNASESLVTLSQQLFEFVQATSGDNTTTKTEVTTKIEKKEKEQETKSPQSPPPPPTTTTLVEKSPKDYIKSPKDINLSLQIEQVRLECETEQYRAEISERKYKQLKMTHSQELNVSKSKLSEVESRIQSLSSDMEYVVFHGELHSANITKSPSNQQIRTKRMERSEKIGDSSCRGTQGERRDSWKRGERNERVERLDETYVGVRAQCSVFERSVRARSARISLVSQRRKSFEHMNILCARISITSLS